MLNSAIFTGGWEQLLAALIFGAALLYWIGPEAGNGMTRWRVSGFFVGWQAFTPLQPWPLDGVLFLVCVVVMEVVCRYAARRRIAAPSE
jgi:hypothetical protein